MSLDQRGSDVLPETACIISADDHLIEPPDLWLERVPASMRDTCPRIARVDGRDTWQFDGESTHIAMGICRPLEGHPEYGYPPAPGTANFDEIRPGCYDATARLGDMDVDGVWGQLCFPSYARFAGHRFFNCSDRQLAIACIRAYNDFLLEEWCATDPRRLYGAAILPLFDIAEAVTELERVVALGAKAIAFSENPTVLGLPSIHTTHWDPLLAVANNAGIPICTHIGSSSCLVTTSVDAPVSISVALTGLNSMMTAVDWLACGALERFPDLKVVLSEGGAGWLPYILERADKTFSDARLGANPEIGQPGIKSTRPPRELFEEHMFVCLVDEQFALEALDFLPVDNLLFEGDYPHRDGIWPENGAYLRHALRNVDDELALKIAETNARRVFAL